MLFLYYLCLLYISLSSTRVYIYIPTTPIETYKSTSIPPFHKVIVNAQIINIVRNSYLRPNLQSPKYPLATIFVKKMVYLKLLIFSPFNWISWEESVHHPFLLYQSYCLNFLLNFEEKVNRFSRMCIWMYICVKLWCNCLATSSCLWLPVPDVSRSTTLVQLLLNLGALPLLTVTSRTQLTCYNSSLPPSYTSFLPPFISNINLTSNTHLSFYPL